MSVLPPKEAGKKIRPSLRGLVVEDISNGQQRIRKWPRKRGKKVHPVNRYWIEWFKDVQAHTKRLDAKTYAEIEEATRGTPLLPRDIMTMMARGRLFAFERPDGKVIFHVAQRDDISNSLDAIGQEVGFVLQRLPEGWRQVPVSSLGIAGGGDLSGLAVPPTLNPLNTAGVPGNYIYVRPYVVQADATIYAIRTWCRTARATSKIRPVIFTANGQGNAAGLIETGPFLTGHGTGLIDLPLNSPVDVIAGDVVAVGMHNRAGTNFDLASVATGITERFLNNADTVPTSPTWANGNFNAANFWCRTWDL